MPNVSAAIFVAKCLERGDVKGQRILDVGSCNYNGSVAPLIHSWNPAEYIGVDVVSGPGVDVVCSGENLCDQFGKDSFDVVLCVEVLEHAEAWRRVISNLKRVLKPQGRLLVTTRSYGYPVHGFPHDFWRFEREDFESIFADLEIFALECDPQEPGIFLSARKREGFVEKDLSDHQLYSVLLNRRCLELPSDLKQQGYYRKLAIKQRVKSSAHEFILGSGRVISKLLGVSVKKPSAI